ncbi:hypothetical protein JCM10212_003727 [Sporobolomyces blumeae]
MDLGQLKGDIVFIYAATRVSTDLTKAVASLPLEDPKVQLVCSGDVGVLIWLEAVRQASLEHGAFLDHLDRAVVGALKAGLLHKMASVYTSSDEIVKMSHATYLRTILDMSQRSQRSRTVVRLSDPPV